MRIIESHEFTKSVSAYLSENELKAFRLLLANDPLIGKPMKEFPGLLEIDWRKDGSVQIIYTLTDDVDQIMLLTIYQSSKVEQGNEEKKNSVIKWIKNIGRLGAGAVIREIVEFIKILLNSGV